MSTLQAKSDVGTSVPKSQVQESPKGEQELNKSSLVDTSKKTDCCRRLIEICDCCD